VEILILRRLVFAFFFAGYLPLCSLLAFPVAGWASVAVRLARLATIITFSLVAVYVHSLFPRKHGVRRTFPSFSPVGPTGT